MEAMFQKRRTIFVLCLLFPSWMGMQAVHEAGHVLGATITGGSVERVILHPLAISRTDVAPNPHPGLVVWLGPIVGCLLPVVMFAAVPKRWRRTRLVLMFFAGFCCVANGAYIGGGSFEAIGDCGEMMRTGSPRWLLLMFGSVTTASGFYIWPRLGLAD